MKTKLIHYPVFVYYFTLILFIITAAPACRKDAVEITGQRISSFSNESAKSDGIITVQTGILPPVTQQEFIPNGNISTAEFQVTSSKHVLLYNMYFTATYPAIQYINIKNYAIGNTNGNIEFNGGGIIQAGSGASFIVQVHYKNVDSLISGEIAQLCLTNIVYRTDDNVYHSFYADNSGKAKPMCLVNNMPHILFRDPDYAKMMNGCNELAEIKLTGKTDWELKSLPLNISSPYDAIIPKTKLVFKCDNKILNTKSDSVSLQHGKSIQVKINFTGGFKHNGCKTEIIKVYAPVKGSGYKLVVTSMGELNSFVWNDGLGVKLAGGKNDKYFKEPTGQANYH